MEKPLLKVENLSIRRNGKIILDGVNLEVAEGEIHVLLGLNGSGKSSLAYAIMGCESHRPDSGCILFDGKDITHTPIDERARMGITLAWQEPACFEGIRVFTTAEGNAPLAPRAHGLHRDRAGRGGGGERSDGGGQGRPGPGDPRGRHRFGQQERVGDADGPRPGRGFRRGCHHQRDAVVMGGWASTQSREEAKAQRYPRISLRLGVSLRGRRPELHQEGRMARLCVICGNLKFPIP